MRRHVTISTAAYDDLRSIWNFIGVQHDNQDAADDIVRSIRDAIDLLASFPNRGVSCKEFQQFVPDLRRISISGYVLFYRLVNDDRVDVIRIIHSRRDREEALLDWLGNDH